MNTIFLKILYSNIKACYFNNNKKIKDKKSA